MGIKADATGQPEQLGRASLQTKKNTRQILASYTINAPLLTVSCLCFAQSPQNWQTTVGLPFFQIEGTVVEWDEVKFDVRLMQRVPVRFRPPWA